jgi:transcriptional regulator with XRE-family HTH domain
MKREKRLMPVLIADLAKFCRGRHGRVTRLAEHLGIAQPHVSAWLSGRQEPSGEHTLRIQAWLAVERRRGEDGGRKAGRSRNVPRGAKATAEVAPEEVPVWLL